MRLLLVILLALTVSIEAMAWGRVGHNVIAEIAERHLTPTAKANIEKYTGGTPLSEYAMWLDWVRSNDPESAERTRGWHSSIVDEECKTSYELREKRLRGRDAVTATLMLEDMFQQRKRMSEAEVMFALKSVIHMIADMHCPAHVRYTDNSNRGVFEVTYFGHERTLHKLWDTSVLIYGHKTLTHQQYADELDSFSAAKIETVTKGWIEDWMEENARLVRPTLEWVSPGDELGLEFVEKAQPLVHELAQKAGYRLAKVLNVFFK